MSIHNYDNLILNWYEYLSNEEYHDNNNYLKTRDLKYKNSYLGSSDLKNLYKSPKLYVAGLKKKKDQTPALLQGSVAHTLVLEGEEKFNELYAVEPELRRNTKEYKTWLIGVSSDKTMISNNVRDTAYAMKEALNKVPEAQLLLNNDNTQSGSLLRSRKHIENSIFYEYSLNSGNQIFLKARPDLFYFDMHERCWIIVDYKTVCDKLPDEESYLKAVRNYDYDLQAAHYIESVTLLVKKYFSSADTVNIKFYHILQSKADPYIARVFKPGPRVLDIGNRKRNMAILNYDLCSEDDDYLNCSVIGSNNFSEVDYKDWHMKEFLEKYHSQIHRIINMPGYEEYKDKIITFNEELKTQSAPVEAIDYSNFFVASE